MHMFHFKTPVWYKLVIQQAECSPTAMYYGLPDKPPHTHFRSPRLTEKEMGLLIP